MGTVCSVDEEDMNPENSGWAGRGVNVTSEKAYLRRWVVCSRWGDSMERVKLYREWERKMLVRHACEIGDTRASDALAEAKQLKKDVPLSYSMLRNRFLELEYQYQIQHNTQLLTHLEGDLEGFTNYLAEDVKKDTRKDIGAIMYLEQNNQPQQSDQIVRWHCSLVSYI